MQSASVTKNTAYLTASYIGQKMLSFIYFVLVARMIGVEDLGKYSFALSFTTLFAVFVDLGFTSTLIREVAKTRDKAESYLSSVIGIKLVLSVIVYAAVIVVINVMGYPEVTKNLVYVSGLIMVLDQFTLSFWGALRGAQNLKYESVAVVINQSIILVTGSIVLYMHLPLIYLMLPFILGSTFSLIFSALSVRRMMEVKFRVGFDKEIAKLMIKISIPFALIAIFSRIYGYIDIVMISKLVGDKATGWYSAAMKIPFALQFIPAALAAAIFPAFSHHFVHDLNQLKATFEKVMKFLTIIVLPISVGVIILARPVILTFYGQNYEPSILPLQILMAGLFFVFLNFPLGSLLNGCDKQVTNTVLVFTTMIINIVLNIFLIPRYGFVGASAAFVSSHTFLFIASLIFANKIIPYSKKFLLWIFLKSALSVAIMGFIIYLLLNKLHFIILIAIGAVVYLGYIYLFRAVTKDDIRYFVRALLKKKEIAEMDMKS